MSIVHKKCECGVWVHQDDLTKDSHVHANPPLTEDDPTTFESKVCCRRLFQGVCHATTCSCLERDTIDKLQEVVDSVAKLHDRRGGEHDLEWSDMNEVISSASHLIGLLVNQAANKRVSLYQHTKKRKADVEESERAKKQKRLDDEEAGL